MTEVLQQRKSVFVDDIYKMIEMEKEAWTSQENLENWSQTCAKAFSHLEELSCRSSYVSDTLIPEYLFPTKEDEAMYYQDMKKVKRYLNLSRESFLDPEILTEEELVAQARSREILEEVSSIGSDTSSYYPNNQDEESVKMNIFQQRLKQALSDEELAGGPNNSIRIPRNIVIASPTQNGKTQQIINVITSAYPFTLTVVSCDNKTDQLEQFVGRLKEQYSGDIFQLSGSIKPAQLKKIIKSYNTQASNKRIVLVLLNNNSQCKKLRNSIHTILNTAGIDIVKYQLIHDEADLVNKSDKAEFNGDVPVAVVHTEWLSHLHDLKNYPKIKQIKRLWVSATPENCSLIKDVKAKDILVLPRSVDYRSQIKFTEWNGNLDKVSKEVQRINRAKSREAILYCTEATNSGQEAIAKKLVGTMRCPVVLYNGEGIVVRVPLRLPEKHKKSLPQVMESLSRTHPGAIIIVGHALMSRGISFVATDDDCSGFPVTATVMFYNGSSSIHTVGIAQRIGRITGKSRPDIIERRLYSQFDIYDSYCKYLKNQNSIYEFLESSENAELLVADILKTKMVPNLEIIKRPIDRKEVMEAFGPYKAACITSQSPNKPKVRAQEECVEKMQKLVTSWTAEGNTTDISKIFKAIYDSPGHKMLSVDVKNLVKDLGAVASFFSQLTGKTHESNWRLVFLKDSQFHFINPQAVAFADNLN